MSSLRVQKLCAVEALNELVVGSVSQKIGLYKTSIRFNDLLAEKVSIELNGWLVNQALIRKKGRLVHKVLLKRNGWNWCSSPV